MELKFGVYYLGRKRRNIYLCFILRNFFSKSSHLFRTFHFRELQQKTSRLLPNLFGILFSRLSTTTRQFLCQNISNRSIPEDWVFQNLNVHSCKSFWSQNMYDKLGNHYQICVWTCLEFANTFASNWTSAFPEWLGCSIWVQIVPNWTYGFFGLSIHTLARNNLLCPLNWGAQVSLKIS